LYELLDVRAQVTISSFNAIIILTVTVQIAGQPITAQSTLAFTASQSASYINAWNAISAMAADFKYLKDSKKCILGVMILECIFIIMS
jgi:hypothetical protein